MTELDIVNLALSVLGAPPLLNFDDTSRGPRMLFLYESARDQVLRLYDWKSTTTYQKLESHDDSDSGEWAYEYDLPIDPFCLKVRSVLPPGTLYEVGARKLFCNVDDPVVKYSARITNMSDMDVGLSTLIAHKIAANAALWITNSIQTASYLEQRFNQEYAQQLFIDAEESEPDFEQSDLWTE